MTVSYISNSTLEQLVQSDESICFLDVRTREEYVQLGHIAKSILIPIHEIQSRVQELDPKLPTVVICQHGVRSVQVAHFLDELGFDDVRNFEPGMAEWTGALKN